MPHASRRGLLAAGTFVLAAGAVGLVTADQIGTTSEERDRTQRELDAVATQWEHHGPQTSRARLYAIQNRLTIAGHPTREWAELQALALLMISEAELGAGEPHAAADTARQAWDAARYARHPVYQAHASLIAATIVSERQPDDIQPIRSLHAAAANAGSSAVSVVATTLAAQSAARRRGDPKSIAATLARAETIQESLPAVTEWPYWTPAHLHAFGALALIRAGAFGQASEWLETASQEADGQPGLGVVITLYRARGHAAGGEWDAAREYAATAVGQAAARGGAAWLSSGIEEMARGATAANPGVAPEWMPLRAAASV